MILSWQEIQKNAIRFSFKWKDAGNEEAEAQSFERDFFKVFGVEDLLSTGQFEYKVPVDDGKGYIDYLWKSKIAIEMKSRGKDLDAAYGQLKEYVVHLPAEDMPDLLMTCDFERMELYRRSTGESWKFKTKDLAKNVKKFAAVAGYETTREYDAQIEVNVKAAEKMAKLHDALKSHGYEGDDLEVYLVRLLFCLFADDTGIFEKDSFYNFIANSREDGSDLAARVAQLFEVLDMPSEARAKRTLLSDELKSFRYIDGGLFAKRLPFADFNAAMRTTLLDCCNFDWNKISPAIFGAMFQGVMDPKTRRELGAHYTSEENILKVIRPLFLDNLWAEFERVKTDKARRAEFHDKIAKLKFLDPACGCGNFLIITYRELRRLELEILKMSVDTKQTVLALDFTEMLKVDVSQFYGIEIEDFPCQIARVGMWLMDHLMNMQAADLFGKYYARLPLSKSATIKNADSLALDWMSVVPKNELNYILGNPPFVGGMMMSREQKTQMLEIFGDLKGVGELDYVSAWYKKASDIMVDSWIRTAFVSTNSITQGEQAAILWKPLIEKKHLEIDFAYHTFKWENEAKGKAAVHCVIIGFSPDYIKTKKWIFDEAVAVPAENINPYLVDAHNVYIENRSAPLCKVPKMRFGSMPRDGGGFILSEEERAELVEKEPLAAKWIKLYVGSYEFINKSRRYCLWLATASPNEIKQCPLTMIRIAAVRNFRLASKAAATRKFADTPTLFCQIAQPDSDYLLVPSVSSEKRNYIPIGYMTNDIIASNLVFLVPNATLYHFGVLTSSTHMAWVRAVCGRLEMRYRYSKDIVYNNFPWPDPTDEQKAAIEAAAQAVLDARAKYPDSSLADLYDPLTMPPDLLKAHKTLDKAVEKAYGAKWESESACVADLMERYEKLL